MRVLITGAGGQLGTAMAARLGPHAEIAALTRQGLDIADEPAVSRTIESERPQVIINCAAFTDVDGAEDRVAEAFADNAFGVLSLARAAARVGATLVHYSTDFVFDGHADRPYTEADAVNPQSNYARSKLLGEWFAADAAAHYVLRVESLFGGPRAKSSVDRILDALRRNQPARVFVDRTVTPSYVVDVADATARMLDTHVPFGLYHCVNSGESTWLGIAEEAARLLGCQAQLVPVHVSEVVLRATRPRYCSLSNAKLRQAGIEMPTWQESLKRYIEGLREQ
jgi:dTDP-4-dehydrorhamnose reductase